jgi:o-succinylbenzoate---CoA ligase
VSQIVSWQPMPNAASEAFARCRVDLLRSQQSLWVSRTQHYLHRLQPFAESGQLPRILLVEPDPVEFLAGFMAACITECPIFLGNPNWSPQEWQQVLSLAQPHQIWGTPPTSPSTEERSNSPTRPFSTDQRGWIMIPTGGSSGGIKFAIHTWQTLSAAVAGFQSFWGDRNPIHSCCVLPLYHVSGLMQFLRSFLSGGQLAIMPFAALLSGQSSPQDAAFLATDSLQPAEFFLSLVPTQLQRLLDSQSRLSWLQRFRAILLGGAPAWAALLEQAKALSLNLAPTYGMTETAAQVATLKPAEFLQGHLSTGFPLPHVRIAIQDAGGQAPGGHRPVGHRPGPIAIQTESLFQGYYPQPVSIQTWMTDDIGFLDAQGCLFVVGRSSRKILSGGENIFPEEVEAALYASGLLREVCVLGIADPQWGEAVTALYAPSDETQSPDVLEENLKASLDNVLSRYKHPKHWVKVDRLPRNAQGKLDYGGLVQWASSHHSSPSF